MTTAIFLAFLLRIHHPEVAGSMQPPMPATTCRIHVVGYTFRGAPGQQFELSGHTYTIGKRGFTEVISHGETVYRYDGKTFPLTVWPADEFSFLQVPLPKPEAGK